MSRHLIFSTLPVGDNNYVVSHPIAPLSLRYCVCHFSLSVSATLSLLSLFYFVTSLYSLSVTSLSALLCLFSLCLLYFVCHLIPSPYPGILVAQLAPVTNAMKVGYPGFRSCLGHAVLSLHVTSVYRAGCIAVV